VKRLAKFEVEKEVEKAEEDAMTNEQDKVINTPLPPADSRWGNDAWSAPRPGRSLPKPLSPEQLKAINDAARNQ
jgi:hypothetical protein